MLTRIREWGVEWVVPFFEVVVSSGKWTDFLLLVNRNFPPTLRTPLALRFFLVTFSVSSESASVVVVIVVGPPVVSSVTGGIAVVSMSVGIEASAVGGGTEAEVGGG